MPWRSARIVAPAADRDSVVTLLFDLGSLGVQEDADALITHFPEPFDDQRFARLLRHASPTATAELSATPDVDWSERWRDRLVAHDLGRLSIAPPWLAVGTDPARTVVIDPGMAFGTGEHPTTRGVIRLMSRLIRGGETVADLGAGSAVLSIAAAKLGATRAVAIEIDPEAIANAEENVMRNGVADRVTVIEGDAAVILPLIAPVEVIVANIISSAIVPLLPAMRSALALRGAAVVSGMLAAERADMTEVFEQDEWTIVAEDVEGEWWSATISPD